MITHGVTEFLLSAAITGVAMTPLLKVAKNRKISKLNKTEAKSVLPELPRQCIEPGGRTNDMFFPILGEEMTIPPKVSLLINEVPGSVKPTLGKGIPMLPQFEGVKGQLKNNWNTPEHLRCLSISPTLSPNTKQFIKVIEKYLNKDYKMIKNKNNDPIFINKDNTKRIRFDIQNSYGDLPHVHVEYFTGTRWKDYTNIHRIHLKDTIKFLNDNQPKFNK